MGKKIITISMVTKRVEQYNKSTNVESIIKEEGEKFWDVYRNSFKNRVLSLTAEGVDVYLAKRGF